MNSIKVPSRKLIGRARTFRALLAAATCLGLGTFSATASADTHTLDFKIEDSGALTKTALPIFVDYDCYGQSRDAIAEVVESALGPLFSGDEIEDIIDESCHTVIIDQPLMSGNNPWGGRFYGRDWSASVRTELYIPVNDDTLSVHFGSNGRVNTDFDLDDAEATLSIELTGERVKGLGGAVLHPFNKTITYGASVTVGGLHGGVDFNLAVDDGAVQIAEIDPDSIELGFDEDGVDIDLQTNNLLAGSIAEALEVVIDVAMRVYGVTSGECTDTESCLLAMFRRIVIEDKAVLGMQSPGLIDKLTDSVNAVLETPIALSEDIDAGGFSANVDVALSQLRTSASRDDMTASFDVSVGSQNASSCATGLSGYTSPNAGTPSANQADLQLTVPYSLIGDAAATTLKQLDYCKTYAFGGFSGRVEPNGRIAVGVNNGSLTLTLPMRVVATAPGATGSFQFNARFAVAPSLDDHAYIVLDPAPASILNLSGTITIPGTGTLDIATGKITRGPATVYTGTNFAATIQTAVNDVLDDYDPQTFVQFATPYFIPHAYLKPGKLNIDPGSFTFGVNVKDGTQAADLAVARIESAGPAVERKVGTTTYRDVPLLAIVKNKLDEVAPPVDLHASVGSDSEVFWLPELGALEEYAIPYQVTVRLNADGSVATPKQVKFELDPEGTTVLDEHRNNDEDEVTIDDDWFRADYRMEILSVTGHSPPVLHPAGSTSGTDPIDSIQLTVTALIRNVGAGAPAANVMTPVRTYVNDEAYDSTYVGSIPSGGEREVTFEIDVNDGPNFYCEYDVEVEVGLPNDRNPGNDDAFASLEVSDEACHGTPSVDSFHPEDFTTKFYGNGDDYDTRGDVGWEGNFPIIDRLPPL